VGQSALQAVIGLVSLQHLQFGVELAAGPPLRHARQGDEVGGRRQRVVRQGQSAGHHLVRVNALDQQLGG
jgi:hypothetical protein